ncbi:hypothetical protein [Gordonia sp. FQ]|uniref:hypothetical protein n=1 Tax=Gordonia sp. FQ TaxID=3446634 RepID=UPI003F829B25
MTNYSRPPTDEQIVETFNEWVRERADAGVMLAQSVTSVSFADGRLTVVLDPAKSSAQYWALLECSPYDNHAELFGVPAAFDDEDGIWLRGRVAEVEVVDVDGRPLGTLTTAELNDKAVGR